MTLRSVQDVAWCVYMVRCADGSIYTGIAVDVIKRVARHNAGKGAKYTRARMPVKLLWWTRRPNWLAARREELRIQRLSRKSKEKFLASCAVSL